MEARQAGAEPAVSTHPPIHAPLLSTRPRIHPSVCPSARPSVRASLLIVAVARQAGELWRNPYSLGARANFEQVFGLSRRSFSWLLPSFKAPPGDGMEFPTNPGGALHEV
eukprot:scaffold13196_cov66-Phaeocystis_antarctica.AAC.1